MKVVIALRHSRYNDLRYVLGWSSTPQHLNTSTPQHLNLRRVWGWGYLQPHPQTRLRVHLTTSKHIHHTTATTFEGEVGLTSNITTSTHLEDEVGVVLNTSTPQHLRCVCMCEVEDKSNLNTGHLNTSTPQHLNNTTSAMFEGEVRNNYISKHVWGYD